MSNRFYRDIIGLMVDNETNGATEPQPLCLGCLEPIDPLSYYCPKCGAASGQLTPYIPFVNIRYNYSIFIQMWRKLWYEKSSAWMKIVSIVLIVLFVPIMLIGLPFVLWNKLSNRKNGSVTGNQ